MGTKILLTTAIVRFKLLALLGPGCGEDRWQYWKPGGHLKRKLAQNVSAIYWVRTWGLADAGSKYFLNKNKNENEKPGEERKKEEQNDNRRETRNEKIRMRAE